MVQAEVAYRKDGEECIEVLEADSNPQLDAMIVNKLTVLLESVVMHSVTMRLAEGTYLYEYGPENRMTGMTKL